MKPVMTTPTVNAVDTPRNCTECCRQSIISCAERDAVTATGSFITQIHLNQIDPEAALVIVRARAEDRININISCHNNTVVMITDSEIQSYDAKLTFQNKGRGPIIEINDIVAPPHRVEIVAITTIKIVRFTIKPTMKRITASSAVKNVSTAAAINERVDAVSCIPGVVPAAKTNFLYDDTIRNKQISNTVEDG